MPRNGSGVYTLPQPSFTAGSVISSAAVNSDLNDIATALTGSLPRDGQAGMSGQLKVINGSTGAPAYSFNNEVTTGFYLPASGQIGIDILGVQVAYIDSTGWVGPVKAGVPVGTIIDFAGSAAPTYWVLCYGQNVSRTTYSALFAVIGTTYGVGDGLTTFGLPDLRGRTTAGKDNMGGSAAGVLTTTYFGTDPTVLGNVGGHQSHVISVSEMPSHQHSVYLHDPQHTHTYTAPGGNVHQDGTQSATVYYPPTASTSGSSATGITIGQNNPSYNDNLVTATGSGTAMSLISPSFILNKLIYAGA